MVYHGIIGGVLISIFILIEGLVRGSFRTYPWDQYVIMNVAAAFDACGTYSQTIAY